MDEKNQPEQPQKMPPYPPPYRSPRRKSSNWWIPLLIIGVVVILFFVFIAVIISQLGGAFEKKEVEVKSNSVLYLTLDNGLQEYVKSNPFAFLGGDQGGSSFFETIRAIELAKKDEKIKGIYIKPSMPGVGYTKAVELQQALEDFKESGKFVYAFMEVGAENQYYNTLPADSIFMPSEGILELNGFGASSMFFKGFFEKLGLNYHVIHFEDFKSAGDSFDKTKFTDSAKYQLRILLEQRFNILVDAIAKNRKMDRAQILEAVNRGLYTADSLHHYGFIDALASELSVKEFLRHRANGKEFKLQLTIKPDSKDNLIDTTFKDKLNLVSVGDYLSTQKSSSEEVFDKDMHIAVINGVGPISSGTEEGYNSDYAIKSGQFVKDLRKARNDDKVKAIIIRIDSPGGSVIASDEIWEEIIKTKSVKPVYASMSDVAASGGYYIAMACDTIIASPTTITGSIGVVLAIPNISGTMDKLAITADTVNVGQSSQFMNGMYPYDDKSLDYLRGMAKGIYDRFITKAAYSRHKSYDEMRSLAKGRVWTGEDARMRGLVDTLGGFQTAINMAKNRLGIPLDKKVYVRFFPEPVDEVEALLNLFGMGDKQDNDDVRGEIAKMLGLTPEAFIAKWELMPDEAKSQLTYMIQLARIANKENVMTAMPYLLEIK